MKKWMFRVACLLAFAFTFELAPGPPPAQAVTTAKVTLTTSAWTDLGVGPVLVSAPGRVVFAVADTTPSLAAEGMSVLPGSSFTFNTTSHVWAMSLDGISPFVYVSPILASGGGGGTITAGTTPVAGTCPSGQFLYNNAGVVGCSASSATIALPQAITGGVSGGIPYFSATSTMSAGALLANNALMLGGGAAASPKTTTTGTGVVAALGVNANAAGGVALVSAVPTAGNFVKWAAGGLVDGGAGSGGGTITAGTTPTSGFAAGQMLYSDGSLAQATPSLTYQAGGINVGSGGTGFINLWQDGATAKIQAYTNGGLAQLSFSSDATIGFNPNIGVSGVNDVAFSRGAAPGIISEKNPANLTSPTAFRVYNTFTDASNGEWAGSDWQSTANVLTIGAQANGTGTVRPVQIVGANFRVPSLTSIGTQPTITGSGGTCATTTKVGGALAGTVVLSAVCATTNTIVWTGMPTTANGYVCDAQDRTTRTAGPFQESASTTTGFTLTVGATSSVAADVLQWKCMGY